MNSEHALRWVQSRPRHRHRQQQQMIEEKRAHGMQAFSESKQIVKQTLNGLNGT